MALASLLEQEVPDRVGAASGCHWCGAEPVAKAAHFCYKCQAPVSAVGHVLFAANFVARNLAIPIALGLVTILLQQYQQQGANALADRQKLVAAYLDFSLAHSDYRAASSAIGFMALGTAQTVPAAALKDAVIKMDRAFDSLSAKLTPFAEFQKQQPGFVSPYGNGRTALEETWQDCFLHPYYAGGTNGPGHWSEIQRQLQFCNDQTCPAEAARSIGRVVDRIGDSQCGGKLSGASGSFLWFWDELRRVMEGHAPSAPPAPDQMGGVRVAAATVP